VSGILRVKLASNGAFLGGTLVPVRLALAGTPTLDRDQTAIATLNGLARSDFPKTGVRLTHAGRLQPQKPRT